jgi:nicotinate-nucleotide pyrophosphorylase (carboxylating)
MNGSANRGYTTPISKIQKKDFLPLVQLAFQEDAPNGDITSESIFPKDKQSVAILNSRENGILCGIQVIEAIQDLVPNTFTYKSLLEDGDHLKKGSQIAQLQGETRKILQIERILLNFLQYLSGIATTTNQIVQNYPNLRILDTRKTLPAYRLLAKYAVHTGGGWNHRIHLSDMAMIKDNHIQALGSISKAFEAIRSKNPTIKIEVELDCVDQINEAILNKPDIILLDNFSIEDSIIAVQKIRELDSSNKIWIEASGGITPDKLVALSKLGDIGVSMGYLTHTTRFLDIGLDFIN